MNQLQSINTETEMEAHTKSYETIISSMHLQKLQPHLLDANSIGQLKQLEVNNDAISHKAADLLRLAIGGYDYDFATVSISTKPHNKKIKSLAQNQVSIWPNPATDHVVIDYVLQGEQNGELFLFDVTANILLQKTLPNQTAKTSLSINNLAPGIYLLMIKQDDKMVYQTKLIKQ
jgi:hypothetical protein